MNKINRSRSIIKSDPIGCSRRVRRSAGYRKGKSGAAADDRVAGIAESNCGVASNKHIIPAGILTSILACNNKQELVAAYSIRMGNDRGKGSGGKVR